MTEEGLSAQEYYFIAAGPDYISVAVDRDAALVRQIDRSVIREVALCHTNAKIAAAVVAGLVVTTGLATGLSGWGMLLYGGLNVGFAALVGSNFSHQHVIYRAP